MGGEERKRRIGGNVVESGSTDFDNKNDFPMHDRRQFASDNNAGICPEVMEALAEANVGHAPGYGDDRWTGEANGLIRDLFGRPCTVFTVFTGTAANSLALASLCQSYHSVICHESAHVETDECGAPEFFSNGTKVLTVPGAGGLMDCAAVERQITRRSDIHYPKPRVLSITQATELGTVYSLEQLRELAGVARHHGLHRHLDGARLANAVATLGCSPGDIVDAAAIEVLCLGGSKAGGMLGDAVVFFDEALAHEFGWRVKQAGQLASKMRFLSAGWVGLLRDGAWLRHAAHANAMAARLAAGLQRMGIAPLYPCQANSVFVALPAATATRLRGKGWRFYTFIGGGARLMCAWDTTPADVDALLADISAG
jgi:threonine aldolase